MFELYRAIWRVSGPRQILLILLSVAIAALAAAPLSFQKEIVNYLGSGTPGEDRLIWLCAGMMAVILASLGLKWALGFFSSTLGEHVIRLIRQRLYELRGQSRTNSGTLATAISAEAEELGKFAGNAYSEPVVQIGTLISVVAFIASTQPKLGLVAVLIMAPQVILVLLSQIKVNRLVAARVRVLRDATDRITTSQLAEIEADVLDHFDTIYDTRRRMFLWKLSTKFVISSLNGLGTVLVLLLGGMLVLQQGTDVGTVVAATIGLTRLQGPTGFLIAFYRQVSANRVKYELLRDLLPGTDAASH